MSIETPPITDVMIDQTGKARLSWILFFNSLFDGDPGNSWTPTITDLTSTGTPTVTGVYYRINQRLCLFFITIVPATDTTSVAATTYIGNFPLQFVNDSVCFASTGSGAAQAIGGIRANDNRIYTPAWSAVTSTVTVVGLGVVQ
jgi:hypothetical protein